jgi:hypothetical protein
VVDDNKLAGLLGALGLAVFERREDASFVPVVPPPAWFRKLSRGDPTFPFLAHLLPEAHEFWQGTDNGRQKWGPVAEVDGDGTEFFFSVQALAVNGQGFLVFELDTHAEPLRALLQKAREQALELEKIERDRERARERERRGLP